MDFDYGVIGGGPAGYTVAMNLSQKGYKVVLFEKEFLGGTCLNKGCIPTKMLLHISEIYKNILNANEYGIEIEIKKFDFNKIIERKNSIVDKLRRNLELAIKKSGVTIIFEQAKILDKNTILADKEYKVNNIIQATGSEPKNIENLEFDNEFILSSNNLLELKSLPKSILIIGSGAIGIEWARIFSNFGVEVTIVEIAERLIPTADIEISKRIERIFKQNNIKYYTKDSIKHIENKIVTLQSETTIEPDFILLATGRKPIRIDFENITTIGDACNEIQLAHYAIQQGKNIADNKNVHLDKNLIPSIIYGSPEIAWIGLREQDCDMTYQKSMLPISALGKAWCDNSTEGFIKLIIKDNLIVGAHIISNEASALIHQILIAIQNKIPVEQLKQICFGHPTYSEGIFEALSREYSEIKN